MVKCVQTMANLLTLEFALFVGVFYYFCQLVLRMHQKRVLGVPNSGLGCHIWALGGPKLAFGAPKSRFRRPKLRCEHPKCTIFSQCVPNPRVVHYD